MDPRELKRPLPVSRRGVVLFSIAALGIIAAFALELSPKDLVPHAGGVEIAREFFSAALSPAIDYEAEFVPEGAPPFLMRTLGAIRRTLVFAASAMSLAIVAGLTLGFLASSGSGSATIQLLARLVIAAARSVHELLWAVVFLAAFGISPASAVIAIAIPFTGVLAKIFSELLDEAPDDAAYALRAAGTSRLRAFLFGRLPSAIPDMAAYSFYRFECAVRSSAVLGFFGFETIGYYIKASFENLHYHEVWTYLYALIAVVLVFEYWSAALRKRFAV